MGQKVNPYGFRLGITTDWKSRWFATDKAYTDNLIEDWKIRNYLRSQLERAMVSRIEIERSGDKLRIDVFTARPGIVIGKRSSYLKKEQAKSAIAGYFLSNDVSERVFQIERAGQWTKGKGCETENEAAEHQRDPFSRGKGGRTRRQGLPQCLGGFLCFNPPIAPQFRMNLRSSNFNEWIADLKLWTMVTL